MDDFERLYREVASLNNRIAVVDAKLDRLLEILAPLEQIGKMLEDSPLVGMLGGLPNGG